MGMQQSANYNSPLGSISVRAPEATVEAVKEVVALEASKAVAEAVGLAVAASAAEGRVVVGTAVEAPGVRSVAAPW